MGKNVRTSAHGHLNIYQRCTDKLNVQKQLGRICKVLIIGSSEMNGAPLQLSMALYDDSELLWSSPVWTKLAVESHQ